MAIITGDQVRQLNHAGALLSSRDWPFGMKLISKQPGEDYQKAVIRVTSLLDASEKNKLREMVDWVMEYESKSFITD